ncbi:ATPase [Alsobacter sp. R-9]
MSAVAGADGSLMDRWTAWRAATAARDEARGYRVHGVRLALAYAIELIVITASLVGAWLFARQASHGNGDIVLMMMLAPVGYAVLEFSRVPLAYTIRTQTSALMRLMAVVGVVAAAGVTVKSMSQLGELMFRPRLAEVAQARQALKQAEGTRDEVAGRIAAADRDVAASETALKSATENLSQAMKENASLPPAKCWTSQRRDANGRLVSRQQCTTDPRVKAQNSALQAAEKALADARATHDQAQALRRPLSARVAEEAVTAAKVRLDEAVSHSQLHSFTAMAFGKDPLEVKDGEIAQFLRIFVFGPAIFISLASTMLALTSIERLQRRDETVTLPDEAAQFILGPYAATIIDEAARTAAAAQTAALDEARAEALRAIKAEAARRSGGWWGRIVRREAGAAPAPEAPAQAATADADGGSPTAAAAAPASADAAQDPAPPVDELASVTPLRRK